MARAPYGARPRERSIFGEEGTCGHPWPVPPSAIALLSTLLGSFASCALAQSTIDGTGSAPDESRRKWTVTPSLAVGETYTDNVFLSPAGAQISDWITQLVPGISIKSNGPRLRLDAVYAPQIMHYARTERPDNVFQKLNAVGTLEVADDLLFLDAGANVDQYDVSLQAPLTTSNVNITGNRATALTAYVSPYLRRAIGSEARVDARYMHSRWRSDDNQQLLPDNDAGRILLRLESGPAYRLFTWKVHYSGEEIRYVTHQKTTSEVFLTDGRRLVTPTAGLLMQAGYERYDTGIGFDALEDPRWSLGFDWTPTARTRLAVTAGKRLDESAYSFEFRHRTRLTSWNVSYAEDVTTSRSQFFVPETGNTAGTLDQMFASRYPDPVERQRVVQDFIARTGLPPSLGGPINFFTDQLFLQKRWLAVMGLHGARNTLIARAFLEYRRALTGTTDLPGEGDFASSQSIRMTGAGLAWSWQLMAKSTWNLEAGRIRNDFLDTDQVDHFTYLRAGLTRKFQPRLSGSLYYRRQQMDSSLVTTNYVENAGIATLRLMF